MPLQRRSTPYGPGRLDAPSLRQPSCHSPRICIGRGPQTGSTSTDSEAHIPAGPKSGGPSTSTAGARLLDLPSYSPDFNPIEQVIAKLKALLRSAAARTIPDLWAAIRHAFTRFNPQECRNYLAAASYENDLAVAN